MLDVPLDVPQDVPVHSPIYVVYIGRGHRAELVDGKDRL